MLADLSPQDFTITEECTPELWEQLKELLDAVFINQDEVTLTLLRKLPQCRIAYLVRNEDKLLISAFCVVFVQNFAYGNFFVTRKEFRSSGYGMFLVEHYCREIMTVDRPMISKNRLSMMDKYMKGMLLRAQPVYEIHNVFPKSKTELLSLFPPNNSNFNVVSTQELTFKQLKSLEEFDEKVTGMNRSLFLEYFVPIVKGVVILDSTDSVVGFAAARPCRHMEKKWQIAPLWAESEEAAGALVDCLMDELDNDAEFIVQCRPDTRGKYILQTAEQNEMKSAHVATLCDMGRAVNAPMFKDKINKELMFVATGCAAHPDG